MDNENRADQNIPNILIVDDVPDNLKVLSGILKENGYKIRPVLNGQLALEVAENEKPDLILLDIMMPGMDGYEVCRQLKLNPKLKDIPVIFISALNDTKDIINAFKSGGVDYITKPFQAEEVSARVATHLKIIRQTNELKKLNATKDKFFSIIAHDLRGPIGSMMQIADFVAEKGNVDEDTLYSFLESQKELTKNTFQLLENLLNWARSNTNQIEYFPEMLDANTIINSSVDHVKHQVKSKNLTVSVNCPDPVQVYADENMFRAVIRNLLSNAVKYTPKGGAISIQISPAENNSLVISVQDNGIGIPQKIVENLFRIDINTNRRGTEGESSNGLGLLLCKEFTEKNGGKIRVESEVGKGSVFSFTVPTQAFTKE
ncbi:MAG: hybrid sensor histidine kinase/response regulator [Bacteroidia bacterium]